MKTERYRLIVLLIAGSVLSTHAQGSTAAQREARKAERIARFDADGDGELSREERLAARDAWWVDGEGLGWRARGPAGLGNMSAEHRAEILASFDFDGDGALSQEERQAVREDRKAEILGEFDVDDDWELSREERQAARETLRARRAAE